MFGSLRRWARGRLDRGEVPVEAIAAAMDAAGVRIVRLAGAELRQHTRRPVAQQRAAPRGAG